MTRRARNCSKRRLFVHCNMPEEPPTKKTGWKWMRKKPHGLRFVDDGSIWSMINLYNADIIRNLEGRTIHEKRDIQKKNVFHMIVQREEGKDMKVNVAKTQMIVISDAVSFKPHAYIEPPGGERVESSEQELKLLGYMFDSTQLQDHMFKPP